MKILRYIALFILFIYCIVAFAPKTNIYYKFERVLSKNNLYISHEKTTQNLFSFDIKNSEILYKNINIGKIENIHFDFLIFSNHLKFKNANLVANNFKLIPKSIGDLDISYNAFSPTEIIIHSKNDLGVVSGTFDLVKQRLSIKLKPVKNARVKYSTILRNFKIQKKGIYTYEKNIKLY